MKRLRHLPIVWGPTPSRVATEALLGSRSHANTIFARNVNAAGSERDRVIAISCIRSSLEILSVAFGRPVRIGYLAHSVYPKRNNYATNFRDRTLARARDTELDRLFESLFHRRIWEQGECVLGDRAVVTGALDRVLERAVLGHERNGFIEVGVGRVAVLERAAPERPLTLRPAAVGEDHGQRDLAFAEIVADVLAELGGLAAVVERVVDQLEGDAEVHPERTAGRLLVFWAPAKRGPDLARGREQFGGLGADHREIFVLGRGGVLGGGELHHLALGDDSGCRRQDLERAHRAD